MIDENIIKAIEKFRQCVFEEALFSDEGSSELKRTLSDDTEKVYYELLQALEGKEG